MALKEITNSSISFFSMHYLHTSSKSPERRYVQTRLPHDTVSSGIALSDVLFMDKYDIFSVLKKGFVVIAL